MKRIITAALAVLLMLIACSCGEKNIVVDTESLMDEMASFNFEDKVNMAELDAEMVKMQYNAIPQGVSGRMIIGSGATAEEFSVFTAENEEQAKQMLTSAEEHISSQKNKYTSYKPAELDKLAKAIVVRYGKYVIVCVCPDADAAQTVISKFVKS